MLEKLNQKLSMKRTLQQGFTLIELMVVVAIIGILAAVAETFSTVTTTGIADYAGTGASTAPNAALASYNYEYTAGNQVASIAIAGIPALATPVMGNGRVTITYGGQTATPPKAHATYMFQLGGTEQGAAPQRWGRPWPGAPSTVG